MRQKRHKKPRTHAEKSARTRTGIPKEVRFGGAMREQATSYDRRSKYGTIGSNDYEDEIDHKNDKEL